MTIKKSINKIIRKTSDKNRHLDILVGIPSYKEAGTIGFVTKQVDKGLSKYFPLGNHLILNADNNSPDGTKSVFLNTKTQTPKKYISTKPGVKGKGNNCYNIFQEAKARQAKTIIMVDADLTSITPEWIKILAEPLIKYHYQYVSPVYLRHEYDGTITNNFCYPLIYGLLGHDLRQPIAGDFSLSAEVVEYLLMQKWTNSVRNYGIDIFMTMSALFGGFKHAQVTLGAKIHKPSAPKLGQMFTEVITTLFKYLSNHKKFWLITKKKVSLPRQFGTEVKNPPLRLSFDYKTTKEDALLLYKKNREAIKACLSRSLFEKLEAMFKAKNLHIDAETWSKIVYDVFYTYDIAKEAGTVIINAIRPLYFARVVSYYKESMELTHEQSEKEIRRQARIFFKNRNYLLKKYK